MRRRKKRILSIFIFLIFLISVGFLFYKIKVPTTIVPTFSSIPQSEKITISLFKPCSTDSDCISEKFGSKQIILSSGKDIGRYLINGKFSIPSYRQAATQQGVEYKVDGKFRVDIFCVQSGISTSLSSVTKDVTISSFENPTNFDYISKYKVPYTYSFSDSKKVESCPQLKIDYKMEMLQTTTLSISEKIDFDITVVPFTYQKNVEQVNILDQQKLECPIQYDYCNYETSKCLSVKERTSTLTDWSVPYSCSDGICEGIYFIPKWLICDLRESTSSTPSANLFGNSYNQLCPVDEACSLSSKQCSGSQPQVCVDTNNDNCGDVWQNTGNSCSGNYECNTNSGSCVCKSNILCPDGLKNGETKCIGNDLEVCSVNQASCTASENLVKSCISPQVCDNIIKDCKCVGTEVVGTRESYLIDNTQYYEWVSSIPCARKELKTCSNNRIFDEFSKECECKQDISSCNEAYLYGTKRCNSDRKQLCEKISGSLLGSEYCYSWKNQEINPYPNTRECSGGEYICEIASCTHNECNGDGSSIRKCEGNLDKNCLTLSVFENCLAGYKCSTTTWQCEPQHQCNPSISDNGQYMRCNPINDKEIQECKKGSDGIYKWTTITELSCNIGKVCITGSNAYCEKPYNVEINSLESYPIQMPITNISISLTSNKLSTNNVIVIACIENEKLGCSDETKYSQLIQIRTDNNGNINSISFDKGVQNTGVYYISSYVKDYKDTTLNSKQILIKNRLDLDVKIPTTNFINQDIIVTYRAEDITTKQTIIPSVEIFLDMGGVNIPYTNVGIDGFRFKVNKMGTVHYRLVGSASNYETDIEEGNIEIIHPTLTPSIKLNNLNIKDLSETSVSTGTKTIEIKVQRGTENLRVDTSNLRIRNPAQTTGEGSILDFSRDSNNIYTTTYNFQESGKTYYLEGTFVIIETGELINIETSINTQSEGRADEPIIDPLFLYGGIFLFILLIIFSVYLVKKRK